MQIMVDSPPTGYVAYEDDYHDRIVVASMDILGMGRLVESDDDAATAANVLDVFLKNAAVPYWYERQSSDSPTGRMWSRQSHFGDSIYLFGNTDLSILEQTTYLLMQSAGLIQLGLGFWIEQRERSFLLRVGIAVGNVRWRRFDWFGQRIELPIGTALTRAHRIQEQQQWIGGAIERKLASSDDRYRLEYDVPLKMAAASVKLDAINWVQTVADNYPIDSFVDALRKRIEGMRDESAEVLRKHANTQRFLDHAARCIKPPPV